MMDIKELSIKLGTHMALSGVTAEVPKGRLIGLIGPNGSGKTTLLRALCGLLPTYSGEITYEGQALNTLSLVKKSTLIGYLPQGRTIAWNLSVKEIVALGAMGLPPPEAHTIALASLELVGLKAMAEHGVLNLSGGQKSRVLLARLLATRCQVLLLDEPLSGLDPAWQRQVLHILISRARLGHTVIISLHDLGLAIDMCDQVMVLDDGKLIAHGEPETIINSELLERIFDLSGEVDKDDNGLRLRLSKHPILNIAP
jgi:iron complex transport system ATP-binding protein